MGLLDKLFKKKNKERVYSDDDYIRSSFVYGCGDFNTIILLSFTENYFDSVIELLSSTKLTSKFIQTSIDEETDELDEDGNNKIISTPKYYLLIGGDTNTYIETLYNTPTSNELLIEIVKELYNNIPYNKYLMEELCNDGILNKSLFVNSDFKNYEMKEIKEYNLQYDTAEDIIKHLPSEFTGIDIIKFIHVKIGTNMCTGVEFINNYIMPFRNQPTNGYLDIIDTVFKGCIKDPSSNYMKLVQPLYKQDIEDILNGGIESVELDEIFQQQYDRFNAIKEDDINYVDIDEVLSEDDPEYNDIKE